MDGRIVSRDIQATPVKAPAAAAAVSETEPFQYIELSSMRKVSLHTMYLRLVCLKVCHAIDYSKAPSRIKEGHPSLLPNYRY